MGKKEFKVPQIILFSALILFSGIMIALHFIRLKFNVFWIDTAFSVNLIRLPFSDMLKATSVNEHPPFYFIWGKLLITVFGDNPAAFRASGFIPFLGIIVLSVTYVRKHFGYAASFIIVGFSSFINSSIFYIVETRMYELGCFLTLATLLVVHKLYFSEKENNIVSWILFYLLSMMTAYTHYYLTVAVCVFYLCMIAFCIAHKKDVKICLVVSVLAILSYLPWLKVMFSNFEARSSEWWAGGYPAIDETFKEMYGLRRFYIPALFFTLALVVIQFIKIKKGKTETEKDKEKTMMWFIMSGIAILLFIIAIGFIVSVTIQPLFLSRYMYPLACIGWLFFGMGIEESCSMLTDIFLSRNEKIKAVSKQYLPVLLAIAVVAVVIKSYYGVYRENVDEQRVAAEKTDAFLATVSIPAGSVIYSEIEAGYTYTLAECYFPNTTVNVQYSLFFYDVPTEDAFYLVWRDYDVETAVANLDSYGYESTVLKTGGSLGFQDNVSIVYCKKSS